jgi:uncharacterized protein with HEPN domain
MQFVLRDYLLFLEDIEMSCAKVLRFTAGMTSDEFRDGEQVFDAVCRNLEIIGEASKHLPDEVRERYPEVAWRRIAGLRDFIAHGYFALEVETLWDIVQHSVPEFLAQVRRIIAVETSTTDETT